MKTKSNKQTNKPGTIFLDAGQNSRNPDTDSPFGPTSYLIHQQILSVLPSKNIGEKEAYLHHFYPILGFLPLASPTFGMDNSCYGVLFHAW